MHIAYSKCKRLRTLGMTPVESQDMNELAANLDGRRKELGLDVRDVWAELNRRGVDVEYTTVAGWFNGSRGKRWIVEELFEVLDILKMSLREAVGKGEFIDNAEELEIYATLRKMPAADKQLWLAMGHALTERRALPPPKEEER